VWYFKKHINPSWSSGKPSLASKVLETPHPWVFARILLNSYLNFYVKKYNKTCNCLTFSRPKVWYLVKLKLNNYLKIDIDNGITMVIPFYYPAQFIPANLTKGHNENSDINP
jgi:hypothetical protein